MADNSCDVLQEKASIQETEEAKMVCQSGTVLKQSDHDTVQSVESSSSSIVQERFLYQPVDDGNVKSLAEFDKGFYQNQKKIGVKNMSSYEMPKMRHSSCLTGNVEILNSGLKIDVIDDTALIETGIGCGFEENLVGFARYPGKNRWKKMKKQETYAMNVNSWRKMGKGSRNCSKTSGNGSSMINLVEIGSLCEKKGYGNKKVEQTKKMKSEVHYGSRKYSRTNRNVKALTRKIDGHNGSVKNYSKKGTEEGQSYASVEEVQMGKKTEASHKWRKCSRTNWNKRLSLIRFEIKMPLKRAETGPTGFIPESIREHTKNEKEQNVCGKKFDGSKRVYTRREMEALRFTRLEEQRETWAEVYYCGLSPAAMRDFNGLVDTSSQKHIQVNVNPRFIWCEKGGQNHFKNVAVNS